MWSRAETRRTTKDVVIPGIVVCLIAYFGYHAVQGDLGLLSYLKLTRQIDVLEAKAATVAGERVALEHRVRLMAPEGVDPDLLDERARYDLGVIYPDELVIFTSASATTPE